MRYFIIACPTFDETFAVTSSNIKIVDRAANIGQPVVDLHCPYCPHIYSKGTPLIFERLDAQGVNLGPNAHVNGDVVDGDLVKIG